MSPSCPTVVALFAFVALWSTEPAWSQSLSVSADEAGSSRVEGLPGPTPLDRVLLDRVLLDRVLFDRALFDRWLGVDIREPPGGASERFPRTSPEMGFEPQWVLLGDAEVTDIGLETSAIDAGWPWLALGPSGVELSVHPELEFDNAWPRLDDELRDAAAAELLVPLEADASVGPLTLTPRVGLLLAEDDAPDLWAFGLGLGFSPWEGVEMSGELQGTSAGALDDVEWTGELAFACDLSRTVALSGAIEVASDEHFAERDALFHLGARWAIDDELGLVLALGGASDDFPDSRPDLLAFSGVQWAF